jgi:hypothetical protein
MYHSSLVGRKNPKRKQPVSIRSEKRKAKYAKQRNVDVSYHRNKTFPTKKDVLAEHLGPNYKSFTRKVPFDRCVKEQYAAPLKQRIISACEDVRQIILRAQVFVNYFALKNQTNPEAIKFLYRQNFWNTVCLLVNERRATTSTYIPKNLLSEWNNFRKEQAHKNIIYKKKLPSGVSQNILEACKELATCYRNTIVENFEATLSNFLYYTIQTSFVVSLQYKQSCIVLLSNVDCFYFIQSLKPYNVKLMVKDFYYQQLCHGNPTWPKSVKVDQQTKDAINATLKPLKDLIPGPVNLKTLSGDTETFFNCYAKILERYETVHANHKSFDVRRLKLPKLFSILPKPSLKWRFITVSINSLSCFVKETIPRGYENQLKMFDRVFKLCHAIT